MSRIRGFHAELIKERVKEAVEEKGYGFFDGAAPFHFISDPLAGLFIRLPLRVWRVIVSEK